LVTDVDADKTPVSVKKINQDKTPVSVKKINQDKTPLLQSQDAASESSESPKSSFTVTAQDSFAVENADISTSAIPIELFDDDDDALNIHASDSDDQQSCLIDDDKASLNMVDEQVTSEDNCGESSESNVDKLEGELVARSDGEDVEKLEDELDARSDGENVELEDDNVSVASETVTKLDEKEYIGMDKKPLSLANIEKFKSEQDNTGVVYMSRVPPHMKPQKVKHMLQQFGEIGRVYLAPEGALSYCLLMMSFFSRRIIL
jgi:hypothetical protein